MPLNETFDFQDFRVMVMPRALGDSLFEFSLSPKKSPPTVAKIFYRLFKSVHYVHSLHILHGDIKPANVLLHTGDMSDPCPLLIDFGHAANLSCRRSCDCRLMTCAYSSPELLALKEHSFPSDIWSLATTMHFVVTGTDLLRLDSLEAMSRNAANVKLSFLDDIWRAYPDSIQSLLSQMLRCDPDARPTIEECLGHRFFPDLLGMEWIENENEAVELRSSRSLVMQLIEVKEAAMHSGISIARYRTVEL
jgi:serine/threonine protein kinase